MTSPFASLISTPHSATDNSQKTQDERERNSFAELVAEDIRVDELAAISVTPGEPPFGMSELSARTESDDKLKPCEVKKVAGLPAMPPQQRKPLRGGIYSPDDVLQLLNPHYMVGKSEHEIAIFRIKDDGSLTFTPPEQFKLDVANIFVQGSGRSSPIHAEKFWKESPQRHQRKIVFKPGGTTQPDEFNLWRGIDVEPRTGWQKQRRLMRHIWEIICRRDKAKFKYLIRWLSWLVHNPDKHPETVIMLKSREEGTGKSTIGVVMIKIFGRHGELVEDKDRLLGRFNDWLEEKCFILAEEILWAGDRKSADKLKSMITGHTYLTERKNGAVFQIKNRLHMIMTSNHDHSLAAGVGDRRNVVFDVSDEYAKDKSWFDPLYRDLDDGGTSEFLYFLQNLKLGEWHPREILKTSETTEQQRMSGDSVSQWSQACINADAIIGAGRGPHGSEVSHDLGAPISVEALREAFTGFCRQNNLRPLSTDGFGKACADMFGARKRLPACENVEGNGNRRPWGYYVPGGTEWQEKVDGRLGIKK